MPAQILRVIVTWADSGAVDWTAKAHPAYIPRACGGRRGGMGRSAGLPVIRGRGFGKATRPRTVLPVLSTLVVRLWRSHRPGLLAALVVAAIAYAVLLIWPITELIAAHDVGTIAAPMRTTHLEAARQAARTQLLTMSAGFFAAGALFFTALNFTLSRRTTELAEQGQDRSVHQGYRATGLRQD
jgi:hypothetical protein